MSNSPKILGDLYRSLNGIENQKMILLRKNPSLFYFKLPVFRLNDTSTDSVTQGELTQREDCFCLYFRSGFAPPLLFCPHPTMISIICHGGLSATYL